MRHLTRHESHHLTNVSERCFYSRIAQMILDHVHVLPTNFQCYKLLSTPPWSLPPIKIYSTIPGITKKSMLPSVVLRQLSLSYIHYEHSSSCHIYTDASTTINHSSIGMVIPAFSLKIGYKLSHRMSSTAAELVAIREAFRYIQTIPPRLWTIITDSKSSLQSLQIPCLKSPNRQLILEILKMHHDAISQGHTLCLQWVPSHCGVPGNELADAVAADAHNSINEVQAPYTRTDIKATVNILGKNISKRLWDDAIGHTTQLRTIDPHLTFHVPKGLTRRRQAVLHRIRLKVAYTNHYLHRIGIIDSPNCSNCNTTEDIGHIMLECPDHDTERTHLRTEIKLPLGEDLTLGKILGPWKNEASATLATKALLGFLSTTGLDKRL